MRHSDTEGPGRGVSGFRLSKWYMDIVTEEGAVFMGYSSILTWKSLTIHYSSILISDPRVGVHTSTSLSSDLFPRANRASVIWTPRSLQVEAEWIALSQPIARQLFRDDTGEATWSCLLPKARARATVANGTTLEGLGYVEHLDLSVLPWRLPITELRWGRFLTDRESPVWIDWKGALPMTLLFQNSTPVGRPLISDTEVG